MQHLHPHEDILRVQHGLSNDGWQLHSHPSTQSEQQQATDPLIGVDVHIRTYCRGKPSAEGHAQDGQHHPRRAVPNVPRSCSNSDAGSEESNDQWKCAQG